MYNKFPDWIRREQLSKRMDSVALRKSNGHYERNTSIVQGKVDELMEHFSEDAVTTHHGDNRVPFGNFSRRDGIMVGCSISAKLNMSPSYGQLCLGDVVYHTYSASSFILEMKSMLYLSI